MTCDSDGNAYVSDQATNRIFKINSLTVEVLSILLFEEKMKIHSMRWSDTDPNLTLLQAKEIQNFQSPIGKVLMKLRLNQEE